MSNYCTFDGLKTEFVKKLQEAVGAKVDGMLGNQTFMQTVLLLDNLGKIDLDLPISTKLFGGYMILGNDIKIDYSQYKRNCGYHNYCTNGVFFNYQTNKAVSILADSDNIYKSTSTNNGIGKADGCIYKTLDGEIEWHRVFSIDDIKPIEWAIGGVSLHNYHPTWEGFKNDEGSLRYAWHTVFGVTKNNKLVLYTKKCKASDLADTVQNDLKLKFAVMLDGGSMVGFNSPDYSINTRQAQNNMVVMK